MWESPVDRASETRMCETRNAYRFWWGSCLNMCY